MDLRRVNSITASTGRCRLSQHALSGYFARVSVSASSSALMPSWDTVMERVSDSRAIAGLWKPSEFSAVHHSQ